MLLTTTAREQRALHSLHGIGQNFGAAVVIDSSLASKYGEQKTNKEKSHKEIWWWECPGASRG